jgi:2-oxoglutarate ferredoxin oxidoreductase subunit alpha
VIPGTKGGRHRASSDEHDETGDLTETPENRMAMHAKRMRKLEFCLQELPAPQLVGPAEDGSFTAGLAYPAEEADVTFVTWGSPKEALLEVLQMLKKNGVKANLLQILFIVPFHAKEVKEILSKCKL